MSGLRKQDQHLIPQDPLYDASGLLRKRSMSPLTPSRETRSEPFSSSASFNNQFEIVGSEGRPHVFEPETDRRMTLTGVAARLGAAIASSFTAIERRFSSHRLSYRNASVRTTGFNKADAANF